MTNPLHQVSPSQVTRDQLHYLIKIKFVQPHKVGKRFLLTDEDIEYLRRYHQRGDLLRFLEQPEVEHTNNRVERMLRPAVIARKVSHCSKTWSGAYTFAAFTSVIQTLLKKGNSSSVVEALSDLFRTPRSLTAPA